MYWPSEGSRTGSNSWKLQDILLPSEVAYIHPEYVSGLRKTAKSHSTVEQSLSATDLQAFFTQHLGLRACPVPGSEALQAAVDAGDRWRPLLLMLSEIWGSSYRRQEDQEKLRQQLQDMTVSKRRVPSECTVCHHQLQHMHAANTALHCSVTQQMLVVDASCDNLHLFARLSRQCGTFCERVGLYSQPETPTHMCFAPAMQVSTCSLQACQHRMLPFISTMYTPACWANILTAMLLQPPHVQVESRVGPQPLRQCFVLSNIKDEDQMLLEQLRLPVLDLPMPANRSLSFLEKLGVSTQLNLQTLLKILQQLSAPGQAGSNPSLASMQRLYQLVHHTVSLQGSEAAAAVRRHFEQQPLLLVPTTQQQAGQEGGGSAGQGSWLTCKEIMWSARGNGKFFPHKIFIAHRYKVCRAQSANC
jgi:hypothetical protein